VVQDVNGDVIVATSHGLYEIDGKSGVIRRFTREDGLIDNDIRSVAIDRNGGRWIGSLRGLSYQNPETGKIITYHGGYGLVEKAFDHIVYSPEINTIYLGSNLGITSFCPDSVNTIGFDADVRLSAIYLNGRKLMRESGDRGVAVMGGTSGMPSMIRLPYKDNALTLRLTTMDFRDGSNVKYVWRLLGLGNEWISTRPGENLIYLPHLDPGNYTLEIKAMENNLTSETSVMKIHISSPWYMSVLAKILYFLVLAVIVLLVWLVFKKKREEKENEAKIKYFMDISHDIRSPITLILSPLESLLRQPFDNDVRIKLKTIHRNANRILSLVNQLLDIRKLEKGKMRLRCRETDLNAFVGELVDMFKPQADEKGVELRFEGDVDMPKVWIDRNVVDKILVNLISNAIKFTPRDGNIVVRLSDNEKGESGFVRISVIDTGIGLDSKTSGRIFDRFYQAYDNDGNTKGGFGIGLDLCRRLIEFHHGDISGANRKDGIKGSVFSFTLPVGTECYTDDELRSKIPESGKMREDVPDVVRQPEFTDEPQDMKRHKVSSKKRSILVVDDDKELMEYMCGHLGQRYKVMGAGDGKEALRIVADNQPDIIVSDVMMPVMDGITLLRRLKGNADTHHIPVVLLSSKNEVSDRMTGWDKGADAYIGKPFDVEEIEALIDNLIDNRLRIKGKFSGVQETDGKISSPEVKSADDALMERIMKIIDKSIDDPKLNVEMLSAEVGISRAHLHRKMKDMIGMTPSDFIRTIRIRRACELLQKGSVEVTQVAYALGFASQSHFSTTFKNFTGMTPSEYRARCIAGDVPGMSVTKDDINQDSK
ncbi:MAG: helix-turn-helix domain-containing protein, partial [Muribaculaceae bacterium]|nr:helix-turn-helix domain-containing protein [Muribaculaceae bacterium]